MKWDGLPTVIFGLGGISREAAFLISKINNDNNTSGFDLVGFISNDSADVGKKIDGIKVIESDEGFEVFASRYPLLGVVIAFGTVKIKYDIYKKISHITNIVFPNLIHPNVDIDKNNCNLGYGNMIDSGSIIAVNVKIGDFNLIHFGSSIGHDTRIGNFCVVNPQVKISGHVNVKNGVLIGTGATVLQQLTLADNSIVGAGAVVVKDVDSNTTVVGIPAKPIKEVGNVNE